MNDLYQLPTDLPVPLDDGACDHLLGTQIPSILLLSVSRGTVDIGKVHGTLVLFFYPMNGIPGALPGLKWDKIPGARGCTPQSCSYRDNHDELLRLGAQVFGISSQPIEEQKEASERLNLPFELLNDSRFALSDAMNLPTFEYELSKYIQRVTVIAIDGRIQKVFYPVFPPDKNVYEVIGWIKQN
jgi:peroxiredoxin